MSKQGKKARRIQAEIREIFLTDWDPIGLGESCPEDEYDGYIGSVYGLLVAGASEYQLVERLYHHETVSMGMRGDRERLKPVAQKLLRVKV